MKLSSRGRFELPGSNMVGTILCDLLAESLSNKSAERWHIVLPWLAELTRTGWHRSGSSQCCYLGPVGT